MQAPSAKRTRSARTQRYLWTREAYEKLADTDIFADGLRVELIEGEIIRAPQISPANAAVTGMVYHALSRVVGSDHHLRVRGPLALGRWSMPDPKVSLVEGGVRDYVHAHPATAALIVEVSDNTLALDRGRKLRLYVRQSIPEYWIVNLQESQLEVHRDPSSETYRTKFTLGKGEHLAPLALPDAAVCIDELLP